MKVILDRMLWVPADKLDLSRIKSELTVHAEKYIGASEEIPLYEVKEGYIGVPRRWGLKALRDLYTEIEDRTVFPHMDWPEIKWPDGWGFWKGQKETIDSTVKVFQSGTYGALLEAGCGAGKTLMATMIGQALKTPVLVMVHKGDLSKQWHDLAHGNLKDKKPALFPTLRLGHVQQDTLEYKNCHLVTAMAQTLYNKRDELPKDFWDTFGLVIYDEGHRYPARTFESVMKLPNARYRLAISATWRRSDSLECVWHWHIGSVEAKLNIDRLTGEYVQINWQTNITDAMFKRGSYLNRAALINAMADNIVFNKWLVQQLHEGALANRKVLLVSDRVDQLLYIRKN
jgi:superfamily II DNA or RNA helicase